jgi:hypothetical protein
MTINFYYSDMNLSKILSISFCCSLWCLISHGYVLENWHSCSANDFRQNALEEKGLSASDRQYIAEQLNQIGSLQQQLGIDERNIYYFIDNINACPEPYARSVIPYNLSTDLFGGTEYITVATKIFTLKREVFWLHPWDQTEYHAPIPCIMLPNRFLIRILNVRDSFKNELLDISHLQARDGYIILTFIPPNRLVVTLHRIAILGNNPPLMRFIWAIDPNLRIKNVCGDGNCGLWAVLEALKRRQLQDPPRNFWIFSSVCSEFNGVNPQERDYVFMRELRQKMSILRLRELLEEYASQSDRRLRDPIMGIGNLFAPNPQLPANYGMTDGRPNGKTALDWKNGEYGNIRSKAAQLLRSIQHTIRFANVEHGAPFDVWLNTTDIPYLAPVIGRPVVVIGLLSAGIISADIFLADGSSMGATSDPLEVRRFIEEHPDTIIIYKMINSGHFQAVIRE